jgi:5-methylcytosine-specific restriction endonuclease McrA
MDDLGPVEIYGWDGKIHPEDATPSQWRRWRLEQARKKGTHTKEQWISLRNRVGRCVHCGMANIDLLTKDHIYPIVLGGCDCIENIQPLCQPCNSSKCART